jgi:hypothetical protein
MANVKAGQTVLASQWWKHLRPFAKRLFWKKQRKADKASIRNLTK